MTFSKKMHFLTVLLCFFFLFPPIALSEKSSTGTDTDQVTYVFYSGAPSPIWEILEGRLQEAFRRIGLKMKLVQTESAQRALMLANTEGDGDAIRVPNIKELTPHLTNNLIQIPEPILYHSFSVYSTKHTFQVKGWESLNGYKNGFRKGVKILEKNVPNQQIILPSSDRLFQMLATERLDTVIEWDLIAAKMLKDLKLTTIKKLSPPIASTPTHTYIHKKHKALVPLISEALAQMKKDGMFSKIKDDIMK